MTKIIEKEILAGKLKEMFPDPDTQEEVHRLLHDYGRKAHEKEPIRVRLAILKLSGNNIDKVKEYVAAAKGDYRDVIGWAEYPRQMKEKTSSSQFNKDLARQDRKQYEEWLLGEKQG